MNSFEYMTLEQAYGGQNTSRSGANHFTVGQILERHPEAKESIERIYRNDPKFFATSNITCAYCRKKETVKLTNILCDYCKIPFNVLCSSCHKHHIGEYRNACIKCIIDINKKHPSCHVCKELKWWDPYLSMVCKCNKLVCKGCRLQCHNVACRYITFCSTCIRQHNNKSCTVCEQPKTYCNKCRTCSEDICLQCTMTSNTKCFCYFVNSCTKCYSSHFVPCKDQNCTVKECPKKKFEKWCEECGKGLQHFKDTYTRTNNCHECLKQKVTLCCECFNYNDTKIGSIRKKLRRLFMGAEIALAKIVDEYCYPFGSLNILYCSMCNKGQCNKHYWKTLGKNETILCRECSIKEVADKIKYRKKKIETVVEVEYDLSNLFN